ncbi:MAG: hypothetical protein L0H29_03515 [Sinobacteraceae bacterium]|nr:hypothetical protein [Nevskiaceae bacterium]
MSFKKLLIVLGFGAVGLALSACTNNRYCLKPQPYQSAQSIPVLKGTGDLSVPQAAGALVIPKPAAHPVPFGKEVKGKDGEEKIACLDQPPLIPAQPSDTITKATME